MAFNPFNCSLFAEKEDRFKPFFFGEVLPWSDIPHPRTKTRPLLGLRCQIIGI